MHFTIYKTTNKINNKIYVGKHRTKDLDDNYLGSGKYLKHAIQKYGIENFEKQILHVFETEEDMNAKEKELVTEEFCLREDTYNICEGGKGGFGYLNNHLDKSLWSKRGRIVVDLKYANYLSEWKRKGAINRNNKYGIPSSFIQSTGFSGKKHSQDTKLLMSNKAKERLKIPQNNSQFGTMWITNGLKNKKIKVSDLVPEGWYKGRTKI